jgi:hypothetical protein
LIRIAFLGAAGSHGRKKKEGRDKSRPYTFKILIIDNLR